PRRARARPEPPQGVDALREGRHVLSRDEDPRARTDRRPGGGSLRHAAGDALRFRQHAGEVGRALAEARAFLGARHGALDGSLRRQWRAAPRRLGETLARAGWTWRVGEALSYRGKARTRRP